MENDGFKKLYFSNDDESEQKRKVLFEMAAVYRDLIYHENQRVNYRTTWFLTLNGFLFAAFGIILAYYKGSHLFLIFVSFVFATLGCVTATEIYKRGIDNAIKAGECIHNRWRNFLETVFGYSFPHNEIDANCYIPPIEGLTHRVPMRVHLAYVMTGAWIALFIVVFIFNTVPYLCQPVTNSPASCALQDGAVNPVLKDSGSLNFKLELQTGDKASR